jgi:hypothetical protein
MSTKFTLILIMISFVIFFRYLDRPITHEGKGQTAKDQPKQKLSETRVFMFKKDYLVSPLADFDITARVLSKERYWIDRGAELAPVDLALGWGPMSDDKVLSKLKISQRNRWFYWKPKGDLPISADMISLNAANMHLIPENDDIESRIKSVNVGHIVKFKGHLVRVNRSDGWHWESSLSRADTGDGACEVIFVKEFLILE